MAAKKPGEFVFEEVLSDDVAKYLEEMGLDPAPLERTFPKWEQKSKGKGKKVPRNKPLKVIRPKPAKDLSQLSVVERVKERMRTAFGSSLVWGTTWEWDKKVKGNIVVTFHNDSCLSVIPEHAARRYGCKDVPGYEPAVAKNPDNFSISQVSGAGRGNKSSGAQ